jgi:DNA repair ATPase RecN
MSEDRLYQQEMFSMKEDISDIKNSMGKIAEALTRLAVLEEKHTAVAQVTNRILERIESIERTQHDKEVSKETISRLFDSIDKTTAAFSSHREAYITDKAQADGVIKTIKALWVVVGSLVLWVGGKIIMLSIGIPDVDVLNP